MEACPDWSARSLRLYPQIIFEANAAHIRADLEDVAQVGQDAAQRILTRATLCAFQQFKAGEKGWIHFERIETNQWINENYRLPPRVFFRHSLAEIGARLEVDEKLSFILRFVTESDRRLALNTLEKWGHSTRFRSGEKTAIGSRMGAIRCYSDLGMVVRALFKTAVNMLSVYCPNTPINLHSVREAVRVIRGIDPVNHELLQACGFVRGSDEMPMACVPGTHAFRFLHMGGQWGVYSGFFGGRVKSFVRFPGPNCETWRCADLIAPIDSADWTFQAPKIIQPHRVHIEWDASKIIPTMPELCNGKTDLRIEHRTISRHRNS
jgi:hypothetical protein